MSTGGRDLDHGRAIVRRGAAALGGGVPAGGDNERGALKHAGQSVARAGEPSGNGHLGPVQDHP